MSNHNQDPHPRDCSPAPWPPQVGELVVLLTEPESQTRGYVGQLVAYQSTDQTGVGQVYAHIRLLDSADKPLQVSVMHLISTGKHPDDLIKMYEPSDIALSSAVELERSLPDFDLYKKTKASAKKPKSKQTLKSQLAGLSADQQEQLIRLVMLKLKEQNKCQKTKTKPKP